MGKVPEWFPEKTFYQREGIGIVHKNEVSLRGRMWKGKGKLIGEGRG